MRLSFDRVYAGADTTVTGLTGHKILSSLRHLKPYDPFVLKDWPSSRTANLPDIAIKTTIYQDELNCFHADVSAIDLIPSDWMTPANWDTFYVDPISGNDTHAGTSMATAFKNLYKAIADATVGTQPAVVVVPDYAEFGFGNGLYPISKSDAQRPIKSIIILTESAYANNGESDAYWSSSTELSIGWTVDMTDPEIVHGAVNTYTPAISGADLGAWTAEESGAVFDESAQQTDEFGFGSRYKALAFNVTPANYYEYSIQTTASPRTITVRVPPVVGDAHDYATAHFKVYAKWAQ
jgi:hypothetical protein